MTRIRQSVPTEGMSAKYLTGHWRYVMPDFDRPGHSIIETILESSQAVRPDAVNVPSAGSNPASPANSTVHHRVPDQNTNRESGVSHERTEHRT